MQQQESVSKKRTTIYLSPDNKRWLQQRKLDKNQDMSDFVNKLLEQVKDGKISVPD